MLLDILRYPDDRLRRVSSPVQEVSDDIKSFAADLAETMLVRDGVGLAAPQVGNAVQLFVLNDNGPKVFINPIILIESREQLVELEGCLSFPEIFVKISRSASIELAATGLDGAYFGVSYHGLMARAVAHEMEHLSGRLLIDHVSYLKKQMVLKKLKKLRDQW